VKELLLIIAFASAAFSQVTVNVAGLGAPYAANYALSRNGSTISSTVADFGGRSLTDMINEDRTTQNNWGGAGSGFFSVTLPTTVTVDFGVTRSITGINVFGLKNPASYTTAPSTADTSTANPLVDFTIDYWNGSSWVNLQTITGNNKTRRDFTFGAVSASKIRVTCTAAPSGFAIVEIEAWK
jgi:hypothetical protein